MRDHLNFRDERVGAENSGWVGRHALEVPRRHVVHLGEGVVLRVQLHVGLVPEKGSFVLRLIFCIFLYFMLGAISMFLNFKKNFRVV